MSLVRSLLTPSRMRAMPPSYSFDDYMGWLTSAGFPLLNQTWATNKETIEGDFAGLVRGAYQSNGVVFACLMTRFLLFSQVRFQFQQLRGGVPGDLYGTPELRILEKPEPSETTADLLTLGMLDADLAGDWFGVRRPGRIKRLRPDWTTIIVGSPNEGIDFPAWDPDAEIIGYTYSPNGPYASGDTWSFVREEVAHFAPIRDPLMKYRGIPLPTAVMREIGADSAATLHKRQFFENAATPNLVVKFPPALGIPKAKEMIDVFEQEHRGAMNAYRTMYLLGGADAVAVGKDLQQMDFKATQGAGETRMAAAMNVYPTIVGLSEGLQGSSLNQGNFGAARRLQADKMLRPSWGSFAGSLETIVPPLPGSRLWYDERNVPFLAEDVKNAADVMALEATAMRTLGDGGWEHDAVVDAVTSGDLRRLSGRHTGMVPVQLQPPGAGPVAFAARRAFWPVSGDWTSSEIAAGDLFEVGHPLVAAFPSLFEVAREFDPRAVRISTPQLPALPAPNGGQ
jgi:Phage portal protein